MLLSKTLRLFLDGIGRREEYEYYLNTFQAGEGECFAAVAPDLSSLEQAADLLAFDLHFLLQLELVPLTLLCGEEGLPMRERLIPHGEMVHFFRAAASDDMMAAAATAIREAKEARKAPALYVPEAEVEDVVMQLIPKVTRRLHLLRAQGGIRNARGELIAHYWLKGRNNEQPSATENALLTSAQRCLDAYPALHLSVASPLNLLQELFTVRGAGSIIRRGSGICRATSLDQVDGERLRALLRDAFGRPLVRTDFLSQASEFYFEEGYRGAAVLEAHRAGRYLSKFAVGMGARGEGLAQELWDAVTRDHSALFWRSRAGSGINAWYRRHADGRHQVGEWQVFWRGVMVADLPAIIEYVAARPPDVAIDV